MSETIDERAGMQRWTGLAALCGLVAVALAGCSGQYGGTYVCEDHVDSSVDTLEFGMGRLTITNYHVPGDKAEAPYTISGDTFTSTLNGAKLTGRFDGKGGVEIYGQTCKRK